MDKALEVGEKILTNSLPKAIPILSATSLVTGIVVNLVTLAIGVKKLQTMSDIEDTEKTEG